MGLGGFCRDHWQEGLGGCVEGLQGGKSGDYIVASEALRRDIVGTCSLGLVDGAYEIEDGGGWVGRRRDSIQEHGFDVWPLPDGDEKDNSILLSSWAMEEAEVLVPRLLSPLWKPFEACPLALR